MYDFKGIRKFHFIGIGGMGMSALAELLLRAGFIVTGSDIEQTRVTASLEEQGARIYRGHHSKHVGGAEVVVASSAIAAENPEIEEVISRRIPLIHRSQLLAELMSHGEGITVTGTHGKTTTASLLTHILYHAGLDPTAAIGAVVRDFGSNALLGKGRHFVAEADESDASLLRLRPVHTLLTNIDDDHLDHYGTIKELENAFLQHLENVPFYGNIFGCTDDPRLAALLRKVHRPVITYGLENPVDFQADRVEFDEFRSCFLLRAKEQELGYVELALAGRHNVLNSLAAAACALTLGLPFDAIQGALRVFKGPERRLESKGERRGVLVLDDYAHHPVEISATLQACRATKRRIVVLFQPHRFSRTALLMEQLSQAFQQADQLLLTEIYEAGESPIEGINSKVLKEKIAQHRQVTYFSEKERLLDHLEEILQPGDLFLTMGAGDVWKVGEAFLAR